MTRIESEQVSVKKPQSEIFSFLSDFNNFKDLMPDQVADWVSDSNSCSFNIKGMASLGMAYESKTPDSEIRIKRQGKAPFDFFLTCHIGKTDEANATLKLVFDADLNPMLKMLAEKPLTNFLNMLVNRYRDIAERQA